MKETLRAEALRLGLSLTEEQLDRFCAFGAALLEKNKVMNLTAITDPEAVARLHFADCLTLLTAADLKGKAVIDVGCGAGFPGVPLKLAEPTIRLTLLDSLQKRVRYDFVVSRAVARLNVLSELCLPFVKVGGAFLAMKGAAAQEELDEAARGISILGGKVEAVKSYNIGGAEHRVIVIRKVRPTPPAYPRRFAKIKLQPLS